MTGETLVRLPLFALLVFGRAVSAAKPVIADTYGDLQAASAAFAAATSWHADEHMPNGMTVTVDYVAPNRWRIVNPAMTELVIGNSAYMVRDGHTSAMPSMMAGMIQNTLSNFRVAPIGDDVKRSARDLGTQSVDGRPSHAYSYRTHGTLVTIYLGANHLPIQSIVKTSRGPVTIVYSGWNSPIAIDAP